MNRFLLYLLIILGFSCSGSSSSKEMSKDDVLLAEVKDKSLYLSEISRFNFNSLGTEDSISFLKDYTTNWIKDQILVLKVNDKIHSLQEIESETDKYRTDLIKAAYQKKALESIDVEISEVDLVSYYEKHKEYFLFEEVYYEMKYIVLPRNTSNLQQIKKNIKDNTPSSFIESYCVSNSYKCQLKSSRLKKQSYLKETLKMPNNLMRVSHSYMFHYMDEDNILIYTILYCIFPGKIV